MKIAFIQTYPIYHDLNWTTSQWLKVENRDKWMPAILSAEGHKVELWGVSDRRSEYRYERKPFRAYAIRLFEASIRHRKTKKDYSDELVEYARQFDADLLFLKGVDGGAGTRLLDRYILPQKKPFVFVIGGKFYNRYVPKARAIFYETTEQKERLMHPGHYFTRRSIQEEKLFRLPKSVDTDLFRPLPEISKEFDLISAGRLVPNYKNYDVLGILSNELNVALIGEGPLRNSLKKRFPNLQLLGSFPHREMPAQLNRSRAFIFTGTRDFFPRVIPEAMAAGLPCIAFREVLTDEVIPDGCGLRVPRDAFAESVRDLFSGDGGKKLRSYAKQARSHIQNTQGIDSAREPMNRMLDYLDDRL